MVYPTVHHMTVLEKIPDNFAKWKNEFTDSDEAGKYARVLTSQAARRCNLAGWMLAQAWQLGVPEDDIKNLKAVEFELDDKAFKYTRLMSKQTLSRFNILPDQDN